MDGRFLRSVFSAWKEEEKEGVSLEKVGLEHGEFMPLYSVRS